MDVSKGVRCRLLLVVDAKRKENSKKEECERPDFKDYVLILQFVCMAPYFFSYR